MMRNFVPIFSLFFLAACFEDNKNPVPDNPLEPVAAGVANDSDDNISSTLYTIPLPGALKEVSGISFKDDQTLACIQDEDGVIHLLDIESRKITGVLNFGGKGDYEGVAWVENTAYVVRSDGVLFRVNNPGGNNQQVEQFKLPYEYLDVEGLCHDPQTGDLLLAAKTAGKEFEDNVPVFRFRTAAGEFDKEPFLLVPFERKGKKKKEASFSPSEIAVDPESGNLLFVDSPNQQWLEVNREGKILKKQDIDKDILPQPEGIALRNGEIWIASEGKGGDAVLVRVPASQITALAGR